MALMILAEDLHQHPFLRHKAYTLLPLLCYNRISYT